MQETLQRPTSSPTRSAQSPRVRWGRVGIALLVPVVCGLVWLRWTFANPDSPLAQESKNLPVRERAPSERGVRPSGSLNEILAHPDVIPTHHHTLLGKPAPDFELADVEGKVWKLRELLDGHPVLLIFYYGPQCIQCVRQLSDLERDQALFREIGARVVAISASPPESMLGQSHQSVSFPFPLLCDPGNKVAQAYRVFQEIPHATKAAFRHGTFVIGRSGKVRWVNVGDSPLRRNPAILFQLAKVEGRLP